MAQQKSPNYEKIKDYYERGLWDKERVYKVVGKDSGITAAEYKEITGKKYKAST